VIWRKGKGERGKGVGGQGSGDWERGQQIARFVKS